MICVDLLLASGSPGHMIGCTCAFRANLRCSWHRAELPCTCQVVHALRHVSSKGPSRATKKEKKSAQLRVRSGSMHDESWCCSSSEKEPVVAHLMRVIDAPPSESSYSFASCRAHRKYRRALKYSLRLLLHMQSPAEARFGLCTRRRHLSVRRASSLRTRQ